MKNKNKKNTIKVKEGVCLGWELKEVEYTYDELRELCGDDDGTIIVALLNRIVELENKLFLLEGKDYWRT